MLPTRNVRKLFEPRTCRREGIRRTRLGDERTYLAWWRTGFASFAVSLGAGTVVPSLAITRGDFAPSNEVVIAVLAATSIVLGVALLVVVVR